MNNGWTLCFVLVTKFSHANMLNYSKVVNMVNTISATQQHVNIVILNISIQSTTVHHHFHYIASHCVPVCSHCTAKMWPRSVFPICSVCKLGTNPKRRPRSLSRHYATGNQYLFSRMLLSLLGVL